MRNELGKTATNVRTEGNTTIVRYHDTDVVRFDDSIIELDTGGWFTHTTKARMNQASAQFGLGFQVYQENGSWSWFVSCENGGTIRFQGNTLRLRRAK